MTLSAASNVVLRSHPLAALIAEECIGMVDVQGFARLRRVTIAHGPLDLVKRFNPNRNTCSLSGICNLSRALQQTISGSMAVLGDMTVSDVVSNSSKLFSRVTPIEEAMVSWLRRMR